MNQLDAYQQLMLLRDNTVRLGVIHEAQSLQLRNWPLLIPGVASAEVKIDVENHRVIFDCFSRSKKARITQKVKVSCGKIDEFVKQLLWPDTMCTFKLNKKTVIYEQSHS